MAVSVQTVRETWLFRGQIQFTLHLITDLQLQCPCLRCMDCGSLRQWKCSKAAARRPLCGRNVSLSGHWSCPLFLDVDSLFCWCNSLCKFSVKQIRELTYQKHSWGRLSGGGACFSQQCSNASQSVAIGQVTLCHAFSPCTGDGHMV